MSEVKGPKQANWIDDVGDDVQVQQAAAQIH
jgi:hypothetical protein